MPLTEEERAQVEREVEDRLWKAPSLDALKYRRTMDTTSVIQALDHAAATANDYGSFVEESSGGRYPDEYTSRHRAELLSRASTADAQAQKALVDLKAEALQESRKLRAEAETSRDSNKRIGDEMEHRRLLGTKTAPSEIAKWAEQWMKDDQPDRARLLAQVAQDKRDQWQSEGKTDKAWAFPAGLLKAIDASLDAKYPLRRMAAEIEAQVRGLDESFETRRYDYAVRNGIGFDKAVNPATGFRLLGQGRPQDVSTADIDKQLEKLSVGGAA